MMLQKIVSFKLCRLCGKEKPSGIDLFKDVIRGSMLISVINKYFTKDAVNISTADPFTKHVCVECEQKLCDFDQFCSMVATVQKQLMSPLELDFAEDMLFHLKDADLLQKPDHQSMIPAQKGKKICPICSKSFRCLAHLNRHKLIHSGQRPYICSICSMSFNQKEILLKHKQCHEEKKLFKCGNCHQSFRYKVSLKSHMINFHSFNEPTIIDNQILTLQNQSLQCSECGKQFATKYKLQRHRRCHTGERPYQCNFCNRSFSQTGNLKLHQLKYHQAIPNNQQHLQTTIIQTTVNQDLSDTLNTFQPLFLTENELQETINETINSTDLNTSYMTKSYDTQYDEIETMLEQDFNDLRHQKYVTSSVSNLKQPETPELLHSLLYGDS